jgi:imidazolonepropionase-like amidohydrolase
MRDLMLKSAMKFPAVTRSIQMLPLLLFVCQVPALSVISQNPKEMLAVTHVTIVDVVGGSLRTDSDVLLSGGRISAIRDVRTIALPDNCPVIDATGLYLIPGLWDMHVHTLRENRLRFFPVFVANGVLGIRDMGCPPTELGNLRMWRRETGDGTMLGPRIIAAGPLVDGPRPMFPEISIAVENESQARSAVQYLALEGVDFIKVYSLLPRDAYKGIAEECKRFGIPFAGHVPDSITAGEASEAGQKSIEHLSGIWRAVSEPAVETASAKAGTAAGITVRQTVPAAATGRDEYEPRTAEALFSEFVRNNTWQVPTLSMMTVSLPSKTQALDARQRGDAEPCAQAVLSSDSGTSTQAASSTNSEPPRFDKALFLVAAMHSAGVRFMAGTDAPNPFTPVGRSLHRELALFVRAGFTNLEALQTATINPAEYLGLLDQMGTVDEGKLADLILLASNPLADIRNTTDIEAVIIRGKLIRKSELTRMTEPTDDVE